MNLWRRYNPEEPLGDVLAQRYGSAVQKTEERLLYAIVKRHLTRREMKCFVMHAAGMDPEAIAAALETEREAVEVLLQNVEKKFRRPALSEALRASRIAADDTAS